MKKFFLMLLALMLALTTLTAFAEEDGPSAEANELADVVLLDGFITDVLDDSLLLLTRDGLAVEALLNEDTVFEGKNAAIGDYVQIVYNGIMTRSLPAKITAMAVRNHMLMGVVSDLAETGFTLTFGEEIYQVSADAALLEGIQDGMFITLYYNGMMTRMIPAGVTAMHIRGQEIVGTITEMVEGGFTLTVEGEEIPYHVGIKEGAFQFVQPEPGVEVIVITDGLETASLESILVNATEILPLPTAQEVFDLAGTVTEIGEGFILFETADGQLVQANLSADTVFEGKTIEAGDFIHVTYNGQMTFSLPGQISAMRIGCYAFTGVVDEIAEGSFLLKSEMDILVKATAGQLENLRAGQTVTVYSNGIMTASLPGQITAEMIVAAETIAD
ncbi:MAG: hypothetical protein ACI4ME_06065 [Aristaeellaceae bacterium]